MPKNSQHWPLSQTANKQKGVCNVCKAVRQLHNLDGTIHLHGPRGNPCAGSHKAPYFIVDTPSSLPSFTSIVSDSQPLQPRSSDFTSDERLSIITPSHPVLLGSVVKHIPKSARSHCAAQLKNTIDTVVQHPDSVDAWITLLNFGNVMLLAPPRSGRKHNLTSVLKQRSATDDLPTAQLMLPHISHRHTKNESSRISASVKSKIEDGNIKAALRILTSEDKPAINNEATLNGLRQKHPSTAPDRSPSPCPFDFPALRVTDTEVLHVIRSFPAGSAGGPDGVRPQHILDMVNNNENGSTLVSSITNLINLLLDGQCHPDIAPILFGGSLIALEKKCGGIRPIAIGYTLRRIAAKCANNYAISFLGTKLFPEQLGIGSHGGCEAAVHATRRYTSCMSDDFAIGK